SPTHGKLHMPKPKPAQARKTKALRGDILDLAWSQVINPDPSGAWLAAALKTARPPEPLQAALTSLRRLSQRGLSRQDVGRVARRERYETVFGVLYALDDPGVRSGKLKGLSKLVARADTDGQESEFISALWEHIGEPDDDADRFGKKEKKRADEP